MFWKSTYTSSPHIEVLLNKEGVSLHEVMDEEDVLEECRGQNKKLIDYLLRPDVMEELVTLTTVEPSGELDERARYKYSNIACELLTCDVPILNERLAGDQVLLGKLYSFLESDCPLNPLLASFFSKTLGVLVARKSEQNWYSYQFTCLQVLEFLKSKENCISLLMKHLGTSAIMDLLLKFIVHVEGIEMKQNILNWLDSQQVVQCLIGLLEPTVDAQRHCNASQLLCDVIRMSRENQLTSSERVDSDPILNALESSETVSLLLEYILSAEKCETAIVGGIAVLLTLLDIPKINDNNMGDINTYSSSGQGDNTGERVDHTPKLVYSNAILPYLNELHNLLLDPPQKPSVKTTTGVLDPPLGSTRLYVAKLIAALLATNNVEVNKELAHLETIEVLLDLFFKYIWNNFLHTQVEQCLYFALESELNNNLSDEAVKYILLKHIFVQCQLLQRILNAWEENEAQQSPPGGRRRGYMGHLIKIANHVVDHSNKGPLLEFLKEHLSGDTLSAWDAFVSSTLAEINKVHSTPLGGTHPKYSNSEDGSSFSQDVGHDHQTVVFDYEITQIPSNIMENYDSYDEECGDDDVHDRTGNKTFHFTDDKIFRHICAERTNTLGGDDEAWNDDDDETPTFEHEVHKNKPWVCKESKDEDTQDYDESKNENDKKIIDMEVDTTDPWAAADIDSETVAPIALGAVNPWACSTDTTVTQTTTNESNWADFGNAGFADFDANFTSHDISESKEADNNVTSSTLGETDVTTNVPTTSGYNLPVIL